MKMYLVRGRRQNKCILSNEKRSLVPAEQLKIHTNIMNHIPNFQLYANAAQNKCPHNVIKG